MHNHLGGVDLTYHHPEGSTLFSSLTFSFAGVRTGLVGPNGIGKSTLLDIRAVRRLPSSGSIVRAGRVGYLKQTQAFDRRATVADAIAFREELEAHDRIARGEAGIADFERVE